MGAYPKTIKNVQVVSQCQFSYCLGTNNKKVHLNGFDVVSHIYVRKSNVVVYEVGFFNLFVMFYDNTKSGIIALLADTHSGTALCKVYIRIFFCVAMRSGGSIFILESFIKYFEYAI